MATFISNGLLSSTSKLAVTTSDIPQFRSNGLLSGSLQATAPPHEQNGSQPLDEPAPWNKTSLVNNGRQSSPIMSRTEPPTEGTSQLDDDLPSISQAFDIPNYSPSSPPRPSSSIVRARTYNGSTVFIRKRNKFSAVSNNPLNKASANGAYANLLDVPIHRLMDGLSSSTAASLQLPLASFATIQSNSDNPDNSLWVDRYGPRKFTELVGNERVARDAMSWLKQWDWCVFGKKQGKKRSRDDTNGFELDEYRRPPEKVLLLSGPPGLGKTTLAHVIARHAGYEVLEINASDARSGTVVDDRIRPILESGSTVRSNKPVLLVLDEIDGATGAGENSNTFIHKLVQLINAKPRKKSRSNQKLDATRPILRPVICICNDHNASSLAKLRPFAYQIRFNRPADSHLIKRLKDICQAECLKADSRALTTLVGVAKGDLRGCLNTLQFIKSRNQDVTEAIIRKATVGMKEGDTSVLSVLNNLFNPLSKKAIKELGLNDEGEARYVSRLVRDIDGLGRDTTIASGCFGHYTTRRRHDASLSRHEKASEWLCTFDSLSSVMYSDGDFALHQYLTYTLVPFYPLFQERGGEKVERNQVDWEHMQVTRSNEEIFKSLARCAHTSAIRRNGDFLQLVTYPTLQLEFAPFLNRIISPPLRPVNSQVVRPQEKALMARLVDIMAALELRFVQEKMEDGQLTYRLDPPIDVFITYDGKRAPDLPVSRYAVRQLVAGEIDIKLLASNTEFVEKGKRGKHDYFGKGKQRNEEEDLDQSPTKRAKIDICDKPPMDFFGRLITVPSVGSAKPAAGENAEKRYRISYRFLEGNSAAVRKPIKVNMFL